MHNSLARRIALGMLLSMLPATLAHADPTPPVPQSVTGTDPVPTSPNVITVILTTLRGLL